MRIDNSTDMQWNVLFSFAWLKVICYGLTAMGAQLKPLIISLSIRLELFLVMLLNIGDLYFMIDTFKGKQLFQYKLYVSYIFYQFIACLLLVFRIFFSPRKFYSSFFVLTSCTVIFAQFIYCLITYNKIQLTFFNQNFLNLGISYELEKAVRFRYKMEITKKLIFILFVGQFNVLFNIIVGELFVLQNFIVVIVAMTIVLLIISLSLADKNKENKSIRRILLYLTSFNSFYNLALISLLYANVLPSGTAKR